MSALAGPIVETTISVDRASVDAFDAWLAEQVEAIARSSSVVDVRILIPEEAPNRLTDDEPPTQTKRIISTVLENDSDIETFLAGVGNELRLSSDEKFPNQVKATHRVLWHADVAGELPRREECLNCGATLGGQYCADCGQRFDSRLISIWELVRDAFGDLFELDSRLWRTLIPLVMRPGKLTRDYLRGQRVRFMPPFRTYLLLSIVFFLIAFFDPKEKLGFLFDDSTQSTEQTQTPDEGAEEARREFLEELANEGIVISGRDEEQSGNDAADQGSAPYDCNLENFEIDSNSTWLLSRMSKERLETVCRRIVADSGKGFIGEIRDNVPAALFVLLPLMALVLKILYPLSKRFYVEHLLFVVHFHAFVFLILTIQVILSRVIPLLRVPNIIADVTGFAISLYIPVYLYKGLRRVYEQGRAATSVKFLMLTLTYLIGLTFMIVFAALFAAFTF